MWNGQDGSEILASCNLERRRQKEVPATHLQKVLAASGKSSVLQYYLRDTGNSALLCEKLYVNFQRMWINKTYQGDICEPGAPDLKVTSLLVVASYVAEAISPSSTQPFWLNFHTLGKN